MANVATCFIPLISDPVIMIIIIIEGMDTTFTMRDLVADAEELVGVGAIGEHALVEEIERRHSAKRSPGDLSKADIKKR